MTSFTSMQSSSSSSSSNENLGSKNGNSTFTKPIKPKEELKLSHSTTICMVPPPEYAADAWRDLTKARTQLRDPGLYRWPPHANLLYPFLDVNLNNHHKQNVDTEDQDHSLSEGIQDVSGTNPENPFSDSNYVLASLRNAASQCEPFHVKLHTLGCFGSKKRGVLWMYPQSSPNDTLLPNTVKQSIENDDEDDDDNVPAVVLNNDPTEPLIKLQRQLQEAFPMCEGQTKTSGTFNPHMTLSHYPSLDDAMEAKQLIEQWWNKNLSFLVDKIYALRRVGDGGQFEIVATIPLGSQNVDTSIQVHNPPLKFPGMPLVEEDWVHEERMKLKQRRNWKGRRRGRKQGSKGRGLNQTNTGDPRGKSRSTDSPEVIAAKRAARKAKRERLEREKELRDIEEALKE